MTDRDISLFGSHLLQLIYYATMILSIGAGLWMFALDSPSIAKPALSVVAASAAILGLVANVALMAFGLGGIGLIEVVNRRARLAGTSLMVGAVLWFVVWSTGARFDSEGSLPLTSLGRVLSTAGLLLLVAGMIGLGAFLIGSERRGAGAPTG